MRRSRLSLVAICAFVVIAVWWALVSTRTAVPPTTSSEATTTTLGVPTCPLRTLPREVVDTVRVIRSNGPFPFPRNDGVVFGNREGHLPDQTRGYYHEYTVVTPGARNRATQRVITGGPPLTDPGQYFYTDDHYDSFCLVTGLGRRS